MFSRLKNKDLIFLELRPVARIFDRLVILFLILFIIKMNAGAQDCPNILLESSFEIQSCCPVDRNYSPFIDCLEEGWFTPTGSADYLHTCGYLGDEFTPTIPLPMPSGEGCIGIATFTDPFPFYEGISKCLNSSMTAGENHEISLYVGFGTPAEFLYVSALNTTLALYGKNTCTALGNGDDDCMSNYGWELIAEIPVTAMNEGTWVFVSHSFVPTSDYAAIGLAMTCGVYGYQYHFIDDVKITGPGQLVPLELATSGDCLQGVTIEVTNAPVNSDFQWFFEDEEITGATSNPLIVSDPMADGEYKVRVTNAAGCIIFDSLVVNIDENVLDVNGSITNINCSLDAIGTINITTNSNNLPMTFNWDSGQTTGFINNLASGQYNVTVTDANGCIGNHSFTVLSTPPVDITASFSEITCENPTSNITISVLSGIPTFDFLWSNGSSEESLINVEAGQYEVTVSDANGCSDQTTIVIPENNIINIIPAFDTILCAGDTIHVLDPISDNGLIGFWDPPVIHPEDMMNSEFVSIWNPIDPLATCVADFMVTFHIQQPTPLTFNLVDSLCLNSGIYNLPTTSLEAISGQWNIADINTNLLPEGTINLSFSSSEFCTQDFETSIELKAQKSPVFAIMTDICESTPAFILSDISLDGITGSWSQPIIDPSTIQSGFTSTFTPDNAIESCFLPVNVVFQISTTIIPSFDFPLIVCATDRPMIFPTVSKNGIFGSWNSMVIDFSSIDSNYIGNTFTPSVEGCEESVDVIIEIIKLDKPTVELVHPGDCSNTDGAIILTGSVVDKEFSIDGMNWTPNTRFDSLDSGQFIVYQRSVLNTSCFDSIAVELISPDYPEILQVEVTEISSCKDNNGKVICFAEGENVEYSINGFTWQSSPVFENLGPSVYTIQVRNRDKINCRDQATFTIHEIINTKLADVIVSAVTDCGKEDGNIFISASGENLEYSIDGGQNYFMTSEFFNLAAGQYNIVIQSILHSDCDVDTTVQINTPVFPVNLVIVTTDVSACDANDGSIVISAKGILLEFSIDGGITWSNDSIFNGLSANEYEVAVREKNHVNCALKESIQLKAADSPTLLNKTIVQPSTCTSDDGALTLETNSLNIEYSIDGGINWQTSNQFNNLSEGSYLIVFRQINTMFCQSEVAIDIINPPCPCNGLNVNFDITEVTCKDMSTGQISVNQITGYITSDTINFMWENGSNEYTLSSLAEGWYSYTIHYDKNCTFEDSVFLGTIDPFQFGLKGFDVTCDSLGSIEVHDLQGGSGQFLFSNNALSFQENSTFFNLTANDYEIIVKDILGCEEADSITIGTLNNLSLELPQVKPINKGSSIVLNPLINQSTIDSFAWTPNKFILNPGNLVAEVAPPITTEYTLTIYFGDCSETRSVIVEVNENDKLYVPNIISLNSINNNNKFYFIGNQDNTIKIDFYKIYDRWGNLIYHINNPEINNSDHGWDCSFSGKSVEQGVYIYHSELNINGEKKVITGSITVIK